MNSVSIHSRIVRTTLMGLWLMLLLPSMARASEVGTSKRFGVGLALGEPTGLTLKAFVVPKHAFEMGIGVGYYGSSALGVHLDYEVTLGVLTQNAYFDLPFYLGVGGKFITWFKDERRHYFWSDRHDGSIGLGVRVPIGIAFQLNKIPIDIYLEVDPGIAFLPGIGGFIDGGIGFRYFF